MEFRSLEELGATTLRRSADPMKRRDACPDARPGRIQGSR
jgi:hypothetical protein